MTYIDYVEYLLGERIDENTPTKVRQLSVSRLAEFREGYHVARQQFKSHVDASITQGNTKQVLEGLITAPMPYESVEGEHYEFRPILHGRITDAAETFGGDEGHPWESEDDSKRLDRLKRYLLYAHRIVLPDPIWYIMQYLRRPKEYSKGQSTDNEFVTKSRTALGNFLNFLYTVRKLIERGVIAFYPQYEHGAAGFPQKYFEDPRFCEWYRKSKPRTSSEILACQDGHQLVTELLFYGVRNNASCVLDNPRLVPVFDALLEYGDSGLTELTASIENPAIAKKRAVLQRMADLKLPTLEKLSIDDIVSARVDSVGFNEWRRSLQDAIREIESSQQNESAVQHAVADALSDGRRKLEREIEKSSFWAKAKDQTAKLVLGSASVGAATQLLLTGTFAATAGAAVATAAGCAGLVILKEWFSERKTRLANAALMRHYAIWDQ
jgi:hypothetical protein